MDLLKSAQLWDACAAAGVAGLWLTGKAPVSSSHVACFLVKQRLHDTLTGIREPRLAYPSRRPAAVLHGEPHTKLRPAGPRQFHQKAVKFRVARCKLAARVPRRDACRGALGVADERLIALREVL